MIVIDTSIWIPALEVQGSSESSELSSLLSQGNAAIVGQVMVEVLRGARSQSQFDLLHERLQAATFVDGGAEVAQKAAQILLDLKLSGLTIPAPDAIIAAHALIGKHQIYTHDEHFKRVPGLQLYEPK